MVPLASIRPSCRRRMAAMRGWAPRRSASSPARHRTSRTVSPPTLTPASPAPPASSPRMSATSDARACGQAASSWRVALGTIEAMRRSATAGGAARGRALRASSCGSTASGRRHRRWPRSGRRSGCSAPGDRAGSRGLPGRVRLQRVRRVRFRARAACGSRAVRPRSGPCSASRTYGPRRPKLPIPSEASRGSPGRALSRPGNQSGRPDSNRGPRRPERRALPGCATPR